MIPPNPKIKCECGKELELKSITYSEGEGRRKTKYEIVVRYCIDHLVGPLMPGKGRIDA